MGLHKILKIAALLLSIVGIIFLAMIVSKGDDAVRATGSGVDGILYVAYIMFALVLVFVLVFVFKGLMAGNIKKTLISVGMFLLIVVVSYAMSSGSDVDTLPLVDGLPISESGSRWVGAGLYTFYIMALLAIGSMVFSGITKIKK